MNGMMRLLVFGFWFSPSLPKLSSRLRADQACSASTGDQSLNLGLSACRCVWPQLILLWASPPCTGLDEGVRRGSYSSSHDTDSPALQEFD